MMNQVLIRMKSLGYFLDQVVATHPQEVSNKQTYPSEIILYDVSTLYNTSWISSTEGV